jgi:3-phenylpropionate/cinnamic acid dioxygenase small subunit
VDGAVKDEVVAFVLQEARLLDERRFAAWLELFAEDAIYWVPTQPEQTSPQEALSIVYEPRALLAVRVARLERSDMHVQSPPSRTLHHVSAIEVDAPTGAELSARSALVMAEWRAGPSDEVRRWFAARVQHRLRRTPQGLRIVLKRVDLIDSEAPHRALAVPF